MEGGRPPEAIALPERDLPVIEGFQVRFYGQRCVAVQSGLAKELLLFRARKNEATFVSKVEILTGQPDPEVADFAIHARRRARIACARLIKRTERVRFLLQDTRFDDLKWTECGRRLRLMGSSKSRRGKRWKIVPVQS